MVGPERKIQFSMNILNIMERFEDLIHHSDITWASWGLKSWTHKQFVQQLQANIKANIKAPYYLPFVRGIRVFLTKSQ